MVMRIFWLDGGAMRANTTSTVPRDPSAAVESATGAPSDEAQARSMAQLWGVSWGS